MPVRVPKEGVYLRQGVAVRVEVEGDERPAVRVPPSARERFVVSGPRRVRGKWAVSLLYVPERTGRQWIPSVEVGSGEGGVKTLPAVVEVKPVPTVGRPESFRGGVGAVEVSVAVEPESVTEGDQFQYRIDLKGAGAVGTTNPIGPSVFSGGSLVVVEGPDVGREAGPPGASFSWTLRGMKAGRVRVPASTVSTFDPRSKRFVTSVVPGADIEVSEAPRLDVGEVLREVREAGASVQTDRGWVWVGAGVGVAVVVSGFGLAWLGSRRARPRRIARKQARRIARAPSEEQAARLVLEGLGRYLEAASERGQGPVTPPEAVEGIGKATGQDVLGERAGRLVSLCDRVLYGEAGPAESSLRSDAVRFFRDLAEVRPLKEGTDASKTQSPPPFR